MQTMRIIDLSECDNLHLATNREAGTQHIYTTDDKGEPFKVVWRLEDLEMIEKEENNG